MTTTTRRAFTEEFKQEAVALLVSSGRSLAQIARELGVQPSVLWKWQRRLAGSGGPPMPSTQRAAAPLTPGADQASEIARLKRELTRVQMERDILKKNCGHLFGSTEMKFQIIADCRDEYPVRVLCDALGVSPSGY